MKISIFGLGYVGCVSAACLAKEGHDVVAIDINQKKVDMINRGCSPIVEKDLDTILEEVVGNTSSAKGSLIATNDEEKAVLDTDVSLICVGTPSKDNGDPDITYVLKCAESIGTGLKKKDSYQVVVARSTMLPGTCEDEIIRTVEYRSGKRAGKDFGMVMNPEFLREGTSIKDFYEPPVTVIGEIDSRSGDIVEDIYHFLSAPVVRTDLKTAEMIKYVNNSFHALKVVFANEIGAICKKIGLDSHKVMAIFMMDKKLNLSSNYLKPGFAFGGSCLPKDLSALEYHAKKMDLELPLLGSIKQSNLKHIERVVRKILATRLKKVGLLGLSFKAGTDDLRSSPLVNLTETLIGKGLDIKIYDKNVSIAQLMGANRKFIEKEIPHISSLMTDKLDEVIDHAEIIVIGNASPEFKSILKGEIKDKIIYDLIRISEDVANLNVYYEGLCW